MSLFSKYGLTADAIGGMLDVEFTSRESADLLFAMSMALQLTVTVGFFFFSKRFYDGLSTAKHQEVDAFFDDIQTLVVSKTDGATASDLEQRNKLGLLAMIYGASILLLILLPQQNPDSGAVMGFFVTGGIVFVIGCLLKLSARVQPSLDIDEEDNDMKPRSR